MNGLSHRYICIGNGAECHKSVIEASASKTFPCTEEIEAGRDGSEEKKTLSESGEQQTDRQIEMIAREREREN